MDSLDRKKEDVVRGVRERVLNLYETRQLHCSEAILLVLNKSLGGGLSDETAIRLASAFPDGLGGGGCLCGGVSGGAMALGLFLGRKTVGARDKKKVLPAAKAFHDQLQQRFGSVCCHQLKGKGRKQCSGMIEEIAALATNLILDKRPELLRTVDMDYLSRRDSKMGATLKKAVRAIR